MKNRYTALAVLSTLLFFSCVQNTAPYINVDEEEVSLDVEGTQISVNVSSNCEWKPVVSAAWIKAKASQGMILISASRNLDTNSRKGSVTLKGEGITEVITVIQEQTNSIILKGSATIQLTEEAQRFSVNLRFNTPFEVNMPQNEWLSLVDDSKAMQSMEVVFAVKENVSSSVREATVSFTADKCTPVELKISQSGIRPYFSYTVSAVSSFIVPYIENNGNKATVEYDGRIENYAAGAALDVNSSTEFTIRSAALQTVRFDTAEGLDSIDFSNL